MAKPTLSELDVVKKAYQKTDWTETKLEELMLCGDDPLYFMESFMKIQHPTRGSLPFTAYNYQKRMIRAMHEYRFSCVLSARQMGKTTVAAGYLIWRAMFVPDSTILIVANKFSQALEVMERVRFCYQNLPNHIRAGVTEYNKGSISFDNGSRIVSRATSADAGRGLAVSLLYADEFSFVQPNKQKEFWTSIQPTLSCVTGDTLVLTPQGFRPIVDYHNERSVGEHFRLNGLETWGKHGFEPVSHGYVSPDSETLIVETNRGLTVEVTPHHPLYRLDDSLVGTMVPAKDLGIGDHLRVAVGMNAYGDEEIREVFEDMEISAEWRCGSKRIPAKIWRCTRQVQGRFLRGLFDGDGSVSGDVIMLSSTSRKLLSDVQLMLMNMGIISYILLTDTSEKKLANERLLPGGKRMMTAKDSYGLFVSRSQAHRFQQLIGFSIGRKADRLAHFIASKDQSDHKQMVVAKTSALTSYLRDLLVRSGKTQKWFRDNGCRLEKALSLKTKGVVTHKFMEKFYELLQQCGILTAHDHAIKQELIGPFLWDRIISITPSSNKTYDFTVPGTHSFLQNGILGSNTGGSCIITSTPKNDEDIFAQIWKGAIDNTDEYGNETETGVGKNGFFAVKVPWYEHPERDEEWAKPFRETLGPARFRQEFECDFVTDDETLINPLTLSRMAAIQPLSYTGTVRWYHDPEPNHAFLVALDPAMGTENDYGAIEVFQLPEMIQVAEWQHNGVAARHQVRVMMEILCEIEAMLLEHPDQEADPEIYWSFENNTLGEGVLTIIEDSGEERFPGMLVTERRRKGIQMRRVRRGLFTTNRSKLSACARLKSLIESDRMVIHSRNLLRELKTFVSTGASFQGKPGEHDDLVSATLLCTRMLDVALAWGTNAGDLREHIADEEIGGEPMPVVI